MLWQGITLHKSKQAVAAGTMNTYLSRLHSTDQARECNRALLQLSQGLRSLWYVTGRAGKFHSRLTLRLLSLYKAPHL